MLPLAPRRILKAMNLRARARAIDSPRCPLSRTLARTYAFCRHRGFWPSAKDLLRDPGRGRRSRRAIARDLQRLCELGYALHLRRRQWALTAAGFRLLEVEPVRERWPWRKGVSARRRARLAAAEVLDTIEG